MGAASSSSSSSGQRSEAPKGRDEKLFFYKDGEELFIQELINWGKNIYIYIIFFFW